MTTPYDKQPLHVALAAFREDVVAFEAYWRSNHAETPEHWPMELGEADWFEQFIMFVSNRERGSD